MFSLSKELTSNTLFEENSFFSVFFQFLFQGFPSSRPPCPRHGQNTAIPFHHDDLSLTINFISLPVAI